MDVQKALRELYAEKNRLDRLISALESEGTGRRELSPSKIVRRGRRSMTPEEREQVSRRMLTYWAAKRARSNAAEPENSAFEAKRASA